MGSGKSKARSPSPTVGGTAKETSDTDSIQAQKQEASKVDDALYQELQSLQIWPPMLDITFEYLRSGLEVLVLDVGANTCKAGFGGDDAPCAVFPSYVRRPRHPGVMVGIDQRDCYVGKELRSRQFTTTGMWGRNHEPNWDIAASLFHTCFQDELRVKPEDYAVLLLLPPLSKTNQDRMTEMMFKKFNVRALYLGLPGVMAMYNFINRTGLVVDCGELSCACVPLVNACPLTDVMRLDVGGKDLTLNMRGLLTDTGYSFASMAELQIVRDIKEKLCLVLPWKEKEAWGEGAEKPNPMDTWYECPDGTMITVGKERAMCPEGLFDAACRHASVGIQSMPCTLTEVVHAAIKKCGSALENDLYGNIVLIGGTAMLPGLGPRLQTELENLRPGQRINVRVDSFPKYTAWRGGSLLAPSYELESMWITKAQYELHNRTPE